METSPQTPPQIGSSSFDRREALRRLAVGSAVVWSAPLISQTAFASSATSCVNRVLNWNNFAAGSTFNSTVVSGTTITLSGSAFFGGSAARPANRTIRAAPIGAINTRGLELNQDAVEDGGQVISLTFSQTVWAVSFTITDVDRSEDNWSDRVSILPPATFGFSFPPGSGVSGAGTLANPFRNTTNFNYDDNSPAGNVLVTMPGPLTTITIRFACASDDGSNQRINFTNILFCA